MGAAGGVLVNTVHPVTNHSDVLEPLLKKESEDR